MKVLILGGGGFIGQELCKSLLHASSPGLKRAGTPEKVEKVVLFDMPGANFANLEKDPRVTIETGSIEDPQLMKRLIDTPGMTVFHLAGIMSGAGEKDFDLAMRVNLDGTRNVLEACRALGKGPQGRLVRVVFASSGATFGETDESPVTDTTKQVPLNTYGMTKTMGEMFVNDYTRKCFIDGCSARLPTLIVRAGLPNAATTSCYSGVIREPLNGVDVALPVGRHLLHAVSGSRSLIGNLRALHDAVFGEVGKAPMDRCVNLPSIPITLQSLIDGLHRVVPESEHGKLGRITDAPDEFLNRVVSTMACRDMGHQRALALGLHEVPDVDTIIREYMEDFPAACKVSCSTEAPPAKRRRLKEGAQVAVVTGAGSGIGRAVAMVIAKRFGIMVLVGRRKDKLEETAEALRKEVSNDLEILCCSCDLMKQAEVQRLFTQVKQQFGRCDLLFNNAGVNAKLANLEDVPLSEWQKCVDTNLTGAFICTQEAFKLMKTQEPRGGRIINNGSVSTDRPRPKQAPYTSSKHALTGLTKQTALEGRAYDIACGQIDIGNAASEMSAYLGEGALQATMDGSERRAPEPMMQQQDVARAVDYMASLPLHANVLFMTVMASKMPLVGRG